MKNYILFFALMTSSLALAQVGIGTNNPHPSAALDIQSNNKGLLVPRVELHSLTEPTIGTPEITVKKDSLITTKKTELPAPKQKQKRIKK